jgi:hypothetical protein
MTKLRLFIIDQTNGSPRSLFPISLSVLPTSQPHEEESLPILLGLYQSDSHGYLSIEISTIFFRLQVISKGDLGNFSEYFIEINNALDSQGNMGDDEAIVILRKLFSAGYTGNYANFITHITNEGAAARASKVIEPIYDIEKNKFYIPKYQFITLVVSSLQSVEAKTLKIEINPNEQGQVFIFNIPSTIQSLKESIYPSYVPNPDQLDRTISPNSFSSQPQLLIGQGECEDFLPNPLAEQVFKFKEILIQNKEREFIASSETSLFEADVRWGALLEIKTEWFPFGHALGEIKYSLALAPAEEVKIAIIDWERKDTATRTEGVEYTEELKNEQLRERSISDTMRAALRERQNSNSFSIGASAGGGFGGFSASVSTAASWTNSTGQRDTEASSMNSLADSVSQASSNIRNMYSTVVVQVSQKEQEKVETRIIKNHNHAHALTILYYEILRQYRVKMTPQFSKGLLYLKMQGLDKLFTDDSILSNYAVIKKNLLEPSFLISLDLLQQINSGDKSKIITLIGDSQFNKPNENNKISLLRITLSKVENEPRIGNFIFLYRRKKYDFWFAEPINEAFEKTFTVFSKKAQYYTALMPNNEERFVFRDANYLSNINSLGIDIDDISSIAIINADRSVVSPARNVSGEITITNVKLEYCNSIDGIDWRTMFDSSSNPHGFNLPFNLHAYTDFLTKPGMWFQDISSQTASHENVDSNLNHYQKTSITNLREHLNNNKAHYWRNIFLNREHNVYASEFDKITLSSDVEKTLLDIATPIPINVIGDYLVFEVPDSEERHIRAIKDKLKAELQKQITIRDVSLPTRGVFAETKLSHCSAAEVIDETRFWKWHEAPDTSNAPDIAAVGTGTRTQQQNLTPTQMPNSNLTIINPAAAPDPGTGLAGGLSLLGSLGAFTQAQGDQQTVRAAMQGNLDNVRRIAELNTQLQMQQRAQQNIDQTSDRIQRAVENGRLTPEQGQRMQEQIHSNLVGGSTNSEQSTPSTIDSSIGSLVNHGIATGADVTVSDGKGQSASVKGGNSKQAAVINFVPIDWGAKNLDDRMLYTMEKLVDEYHFSLNGAAGIVGNLVSESNLWPNRIEGPGLGAEPLTNPLDNPMTSWGFNPVLEQQVIDGVPQVDDAGNPKMIHGRSVHTTLFTADQVRYRNSHIGSGPFLPGVGIAQWTSSNRRRGLFGHEYNHIFLGSNILFNMDAQINYVKEELETTYKRLYDSLRGVITIENASERVTREYETPGVIVHEATNPDAALRRINASITHSRRALEFYNINHPPAE